MPSWCPWTSSSSQSAQQSSVRASSDNSTDHRDNQNLLHVELELGALENVAIGAADLSRAGADAGQQAAIVELLLHLRVDDAILLELGNAGSAGLARRDQGLLRLLLLAEHNAVVALVPLAVGGSINLHNAALDQGLGAHKLVIGGVVLHSQDSGLECRS